MNVLRGSVLSRSPPYFFSFLQVRSRIGARRRRLFALMIYDNLQRSALYVKFINIRWLRVKSERVMDDVGVLS